MVYFQPDLCRNIISVIKNLAKKLSQKWTEMARKLVKSLFWHHFLELKIFWPKIVFCPKWSEMAKNWSNHFLSRIKVQSRGPFWNNLVLIFLLLNLRSAQLYVSFSYIYKALSYIDRIFCFNWQGTSLKLSISLTLHKYFS